METSEFTVSVIIPVFNNESTLQRAISSCLKQTHLPVEIILVNNNSTDNSQIIINENLLRNPEIIVALQENKPGANAARNAGLRAATGNWIQLLDADDELLPCKLKHQSDIVSNHPEVDVIYADSLEFIFNYNENRYVVFRENNTEKDIVTGLIHSRLGRTNANLWRFSMLENVNFFDESKTSNQEYFLMLSMFRAGAVFIRDADINTKIYVDGDSISRTSSPKRSIEMLSTRLSYFEELSENLYIRDKKYLGYMSVIRKKMNLSFYNNYYNYRKFCESELSQIKLKYFLNPSLSEKLITHAHQIYAQYCPKKGMSKYIIFIYYFFAKMGKLTN